MVLRTTIFRKKHRFKPFLHLKNKQFIRDFNHLPGSDPKAR